MDKYYGDKYELIRKNKYSNGMNNKDDPKGGAGGMLDKKALKKIVKGYYNSSEDPVNALKDALKKDHSAWTSGRIIRNSRTGRYKSVDEKNREGKFQARQRTDDSIPISSAYFSNLIGFSIPSGIKQSAISILPIYGKYNKYKKKKALYASGKYKGNIDKNDGYGDFQIGDDFGDLKKDVAIKLFGTHKKLSSEQKREVKAYIKRLMSGQSIDVTRLQGVNVN